MEAHIDKDDSQNVDWTEVQTILHEFEKILPPDKSDFIRSLNDLYRNGATLVRFGILWSELGKMGWRQKYADAKRKNNLLVYSLFMHVPFWRISTWIATMRDVHKKLHGDKKLSRFYTEWRSSFIEGTRYMLGPPSDLRKKIQKAGIAFEPKKDFRTCIWKHVQLMNPFAAVVANRFMMARLIDRGLGTGGARTLSNSLLHSRWINQRLSKLGPASRFREGIPGSVRIGVINAALNVLHFPSRRFPIDELIPPMPWFVRWEDLTIFRTPRNATKSLSPLLESNLEGVLQWANTRNDELSFEFLLFLIEKLNDIASESSELLEAFLQAFPIQDENEIEEYDPKRLDYIRFFREDKIEEIYTAKPVCLEGSDYLSGNNLEERGTLTLREPVQESDKISPEQRRSDTTTSLLALQATAPPIDAACPQPLWRQTSRSMRPFPPDEACDLSGNFSNLSLSDGNSNCHQAKDCEQPHPAPYIRPVPPAFFADSHCLPSIHHFPGVPMQHQYPYAHQVPHTTSTPFLIPYPTTHPPPFRVPFLSQRRFAHQEPSTTSHLSQLPLAYHQANHCVSHRLPPETTSGSPRFYTSSFSLPPPKYSVPPHTSFSRNDPNTKHPSKSNANASYSSVDYSTSSAVSSLSSNHRVTQSSLDSAETPNTSGNVSFPGVYYWNNDGYCYYHPVLDGNNMNDSRSQYHSQGTNSGGPLSNKRQRVETATLLSQKAQEEQQQQQPFFIPNTTPWNQTRLQVTQASMYARSRGMEKAVATTLVFIAIFVIWAIAATKSRRRRQEAVLEENTIKGA